MFNFQENEELITVSTTKEKNKQKHSYILYKQSIETKDISIYLPIYLLP